VSHAATTARVRVADGAEPDETEFKMIIQQPSCCPCWQYFEASASDLAEVTAFADVHAAKPKEDAS